MMDLQFEQVIVQNAAIGAVALWRFVATYFETTQQTDGPELPVVMLVLPIVFHERSSESICRMKSASGLLKALVEYPEMPAGLQIRLEATAHLTLQSLNLAISTSLLRLDRAQPWPRYTPARNSLPAPLSPAQPDTKRILAASQRLGWWFAAEDVSSLSRLLNVQY